tara:strand:- start:731 stop:1156 length:426 start_codon:yes stop_codon:yes gene_type:complete
MFRNILIVAALFACQSLFAANHNTTRSNQAAGIADISSDQLEEYNYDLRKESGEGFASGEYLRKMEDISFVVEANKTLAAFGLLSNLIEKNLEELDCQNSKEFKECVNKAIMLAEEEAMKTAVKARRGGGGGIKIDVKTKH